MNEVYIVGGGSSLLNFPFDCLKDKNTIAINMAALDVPNPTYCITADSRIFRELEKGRFAKAEPTTWVLVTNPEHCTMKWQSGKFVHQGNGHVFNLFVPNMIIRNTGTEGIGFSFNDFRTGYNSGFCGFQLAVLLGYTKIYLLGFDFVTANNKCHYHTRYNNRIIPQNELDQFLHNFENAVMEVHQNTAIQIVSCSPVSPLNKIMTYIPLSDIPPASKIAPSVDLEPAKIVSDVVARNIKLSLLICSLKDRHEKLQRLLSCLKPQLNSKVEVLIETDQRKITTGAKRNILLKKAVGDYIAFIDDDDLVSDDYVSKILEAIKTKPDCVGIKGQVTFAKKRISKPFIHSVKYATWFQKGGIYYRCPNHISPVKRKLALRIGFPDVYTQEDLKYSMELYPFLKTEVFIDSTLYYYLT